MPLGHDIGECTKNVSRAVLETVSKSYYGGKHAKAVWNRAHNDLRSQEVKQRQKKQRSATFQEHDDTMFLRVSAALIPAQLRARPANASLN